MQIFRKSERIRPGDRVVVGSWAEMKTFVERVERDPLTGDVAVYLDWGDHGKSRVWEHDEGKIWYRCQFVN